MSAVVIVALAVYLIADTLLKRRPVERPHVHHHGADGYGEGL